jgi:hypothetical protein
MVIVHARILYHLASATAYACRGHSDHCVRFHLFAAGFDPDDYMDLSS